MPAEPLHPLTPRRRDDAAALTVAVQANLVALKVAWSRRAGASSDDHPIHTPSPGAVLRFRDVLIDRAVMAAYSDGELALRTRQTWGEFSLLCWAFHMPDPQHPPDFAALVAGHPFRAPAELVKKEAEIARRLWRLQHEQRARLDKDARRSPEFQRDHEIAVTIPIKVDDMDIRLCTVEQILAASCEHAGMLGAVRWLIDDRRAWGEPGIMNLA